MLPDNIREWLLEDNNPHVKYRTKIDLLGESPENDEMRDLKACLPETRWAKRIWRKMHPDGYWLNRGKGDTVDYAMSSSTHFVLANLAELGLDRSEARVALAVERYLDLAPSDTHNHQSCLYAYNLRTWAMLGYHNDSRVRERLHVMLNDTRFDGGYLCIRKSFNEKTKSCIRGCHKALMAYAEYPETWDHPRCKQLISYFLNRRIFHRTDRPDEIVRGELVASIFPFTISGSLLEPLYALNKMGYGHHPALEPAWQKLEEKRVEDGSYIVDGYSPTLLNPGPKEKPNKWVTYYVYLAKLYREEARSRETT